MARKGEIGDITTYGQYLYIKRCADADADSRGQEHRAGRDDKGRIVEPGGGPADSPVSPAKAQQMLNKFAASGLSPNQLPKSSDSSEAQRKRDARPVVRGGKKGSVIAPAKRPPGTATVLKRKQRILSKWQALQKKHGVISQSKEYLSKSINEDFNSALNEALGL